MSWVVVKVPCAPQPLACILRSGMTSRSKCASFSMSQMSWSRAGPRRPAVIILVLSGTGAPVALVKRSGFDMMHSPFQKWLLLHSRGVAVPMSSHPIVVALFSLQPFFFNDLQEGGALLGPWGSIRPRNPIRAQRESAQLQDAQARAQTLLQRSHPCVE